MQSVCSLIRCFLAERGRAGRAGRTRPTERSLLLAAQGEPVQAFAGVNQQAFGEFKPQEFRAVDGFTVQRKRKLGQELVLSSKHRFNVTGKLIRAEPELLTIKASHRCTSGETEDQQQTQSGCQGQKPSKKAIHMSSLCPARMSPGRCNSAQIIVR
jgi:hypothetical protein